MKKSPPCTVRQKRSSNASMVVSVRLQSRKLVTERVQVGPDGTLVTRVVNKPIAIKRKRVDLFESKTLPETLDRAFASAVAAAKRLHAAG